MSRGIFISETERRSVRKRIASRHVVGGCRAVALAGACESSQQGFAGGVLSKRLGSSCCICPTVGRRGGGRIVNGWNTQCVPPITRRPLLVSYRVAVAIGNLSAAVPH